jgi:hypothetical protein
MFASQLASIQALNGRNMDQLNRMIQAAVQAQLTAAAQNQAESIKRYQESVRASLEAYRTEMSRYAIEAAKPKVNDISMTIQFYAASSKCLRTSPLPT